MTNDITNQGGQIKLVQVYTIARNPAARGQVFGLSMLGFALVEAVALYALVATLALVVVVPRATWPGLHVALVVFTCAGLVQTAWLARRAAAHG